MQKIAIKPGSAAAAGLILCLPGGILLSLALLGVDPYLGPLLTAENSRIGSFIAAGAFLLFPVAFILNLWPVIQNARAGNSLTTQPANLLLAVAIVFMIAWVAGVIVVDQYPCWVGVPNCD